MRFWTLGIVYFFTFNTLTWAGPSDSALVFVEDDRSTVGDRIFSRFEVGPNHKVKWETSGEGIFCPSIAGYFGGTVDATLHEKLLNLGLKAIDNQDQTTNVLPFHDQRKRQSSSKIIIIQKGKTSKASINKGGTSFENFYNILMEVKRTLKPIRGVIVKASKIKNDIQIRFELLGTGPFNLIFDKERPTQFALPLATDMIYAIKPKREQISLNQKNKVYTLTLKGKFEQTTKVYYTNGNILHHADKKIPIQEIALCAEL